MLVDGDGERDFVKVLDFGIAQLAASDTAPDYRTRTGAIIGTPAYMSPEQAWAKRRSTRAAICMRWA